METWLKKLEVSIFNLRTFQIADYFLKICSVQIRYLFFKCALIKYNAASKVVQIRAALVPVPSPDKWGGLRQEGHPA